MHGFPSALLVICFFASLCNFDCTFCSGYIAVMIATRLIAITLDAKTPVITISHHSVRAFSSFTSFLRNLKIERSFSVVVWVISYKSYPGTSEPSHNSIPGFLDISNKVIRPVPCISRGHNRHKREHLNRLRQCRGPLRLSLVWDQGEAPALETTRWSCCQREIWKKKFLMTPGHFHNIPCKP